MVEAVIVGTIGLDDVITPFGKRKELLGGSAVYASYACSFFAKPGVVSIMGDDFPVHYKDFLIQRGIDIQGVTIKGKNFRWQGMYEYDMNEAKTLKTELNSLTEFNPTLPESYQQQKYVFLANIDPELQLRALHQIQKPQLVVMDTMNFWITHKRNKVLEVIHKADILLLNDAEARQLFDTVNLRTAAYLALNLGATYVIIKKGEHGALLFSKDAHFNAPGYPLEVIKDPTGCGDSFAGGLLGYLTTVPFSEKELRKAIVYGSVIASFNAEDFSLERLKTLTMDAIKKRYTEFEAIRSF